MKRFFLLIAFFTLTAHAQDEKLAKGQSTPPPEPATDEYGIPLKLQNPKKVPAATAGAATSSKGAGSTASTDTYGMPNRRTSGARKTAVRRSEIKQDGGASGKLIRSKARPKASNSPAPQVVAPEVLEDQASKELILPPKDLSTGVLPTPATVRSHVEEIRNPMKPLKYRLGVSLQPYTPKGTMAVGDLAPYDVSSVGTSAMVGLEGQFLPFKFADVPGLQAGAFGSVGYAQYSVQLRSPNGFNLDNTRLHVIKIQGGATASYQLPKSPLWSVHGNLGLGRLLEIQSSMASYANSSSGVLFASLGAAAERSILPNFSAYAGYDLRLPIDRSTAGADLPLHNVLLGVLGNFE